jgi:YD repeat-containing protein
MRAAFPLLPGKVGSPIERSLWRMVLPCLLLLLYAVIPAAHAAPTDCIGDSPDGRMFCRSSVPTHFSYGLCYENAAAFWRDNAMCYASGGTPGPNGTCPGSTPNTEDNVAPRAVLYGQYSTGESCTLAQDTGWDAVHMSNWCWNANGPGYEEGYLTFSVRHFVASCGQSGGQVPSTALKTRQLQCSVGYTYAYTSSGWRCVRPIESCDGCPVEGNPITPGTGVKIQTELDYQHPRGLELRRHYHSFRFHEPYTETPGAHSENHFDAAWRSNFNKRVIPLTRPYATAALALPSGDVQYFDNAGNEILNYRGAKARLVTVAGVGYYYLGADEVEFYGADGRLRSISRRTGQVFTLTYSDGTTGPGGGYALDAAGNPTAKAMPANLLIRVADAEGNALSFGYNLGGRVVVMTDPAGGSYRYSYDAKSNLVSVRYPDLTTRTYAYNEPANMLDGSLLPAALTSIVDENGVTFASFKYDASGRAVETEHAGGAQRYQLTYNADGTTTVTDPLGTVRTHQFQTVDGISRFAGTSQPGGAGFSAGVQGRTLDASGNIASQTDFNGVKSCYAYEAARNLETVRVEGLPSATSCAAVTAAGAALPAGSRKIVTEWHARWRVPLRISEPGRRTTFAYHGEGGASCAPPSAIIADGSAQGQAIGVPCTKTVQATNDSANGAQGFDATLQGLPREWSYTYNSTGNPLTVNGPRTDASDITTYTYYASSDPEPGRRGNIATIRNAADHLTEITAYNAHGQPLTIVDPNGLTTTLTYTVRLRLETRTVGIETTSYDYDDAGQLTKVTLPDGSFLSYTYDTAHRLTDIADKQGNRITYTLDAMGNRTLEEVRDPANQLAQKRSREFNSLNRLFKELGAQNQATEYGYDDQGNVLTVKDPLNRITTNQYDALNRVMQVNAPLVGNPPASPVTRYAYNGLDALTQVTDPRNLVTGYTVDGLGNLTQQASPDAGNTNNTYDAAGNLLTQTDAKTQTTTYAYDALNRVTLITFHDGSKQAYAYDQPPNGIGRLFSITERNAANEVTSLIAYAYDLQGRVTSETRTVAGVQYLSGYRYDSSGRLDQLTYPSLRTVNYTFDELGRVNGVTTTKPGAQQQTAVSEVLYHPFGGVKSYTLGNGQVYTRGIDLDGRIASYTLGSESFAIGYDLASRIEFISRFQPATPPNTNTYGYDSLDRLTSATLPGGTQYGYSYDPVGNRLSRNSDQYSYSTTNNRIASITPSSGPVRNFVFDPNGSTAADGNNTYVYDTRGRMMQATSSLGATDYQVNALGQRIRKANTLGDTVFHYDTQGRLIAETGPGGALKRELIYLGDIPVGVVQ